MLRKIDQACMAVLADSCSVQNVLSSATLYAACARGRFQFAVTRYCLYECLDKPRRANSAGDLTIRQRLRDARAKGGFVQHDLTVDDLQETAVLRLRKRLGAGELSTIALAKRFGIGVQTDDDRAEKLAVEVLGDDRVQTTPHVLGWMFFHGLLADHELAVVVEEHRSVGRNLGVRFSEAHVEACRVKLLRRNLT